MERPSDIIILSAARIAEYRILIINHIRKLKSLANQHAFIWAESFIENKFPFKPAEIQRA